MRAVAMSVESDQLELIEKYVKHSNESIKIHAAYAFSLTGSRKGYAALGKKALNHISISQQITAALMIGKEENSCQKVMQLTQQYEGENLRMLLSVMGLIDWVSDSPQYALASISTAEPSERFAAAQFIEVYYQEKELESVVVEKFNTRPAGTAWTIESKEFQLLARVIEYAPPHAVSRAIALLSHLDQNVKKQDGWNLAWTSYKQRHEKVIATCAKLQSLFASVASIREVAFEGLVTLGEDPNYLAGQSLETGHLDSGTRGLKLLSKEAGKDGVKILENAMLERRDDLTIEAAKLLCETKPVTQVATLALDARYPNMRTIAVQWLAQELKNGDKKAQKSLVKATNSDQYELRLKAVQALARQKDGAAFEILKAMLDEVHNEKECRPLISAFSELGDANAAKVLIDRAARESSDKPKYESLVSAAATYRRVEDVPALLELAQRDAWKLTCYGCIFAISGSRASCSSKMVTESGNR